MQTINRLRLVAIILLALAAIECDLPAPFRPDPTLNGFVSRVTVDPAYVDCSVENTTRSQGSLRVDSTQFGEVIVVPIYCGLPIRIRSSNVAGDINSFALGDQIVMSICRVCEIGLSRPPVVPPTAVEIEK